jgi:hypothetical protein
LEANIDAVLVLSGQPKKYIRGRHMYDINEKTLQLKGTLPRLLGENKQLGLTKFTPKNYISASFQLKGIDYMIKVNWKNF